MKCDSCGVQFDYNYYINDEYWLSAVGKKEGHICAHCVLQVLSGESWYIIHAEPLNKIYNQLNDMKKHCRRPPTLKEQVSGFEDSRYLQMLKVPQQSIWYWCNEQKTGLTKAFLQPGSTTWPIDGHGYNRSQYNQVCSAFTVSELGAMLPSGFDSYYSTTSGVFEREDERWTAKFNDIEVHGPTEAVVRTKLLIKLLEKGVIRYGEGN